MNCRPSVFVAILAFLAPLGCGEEAHGPSPAAPTPGAGSVVHVAAEQTLFQTEITAGPPDGGQWEPDVSFRWRSPGAERFRWTLITKDEYSTDTGQPFTTAGFVAWAETLSFHPDLHGGYDRNRPAWIETRDRSARAEDLPLLGINDTPQLYGFGVRAIDRSGVESLGVPDNFRRFQVTEYMVGPLLVLESNIGEIWRSGQPIIPRDIAAGVGLRFSWSATPGWSQTAPKAFTYAVDDSSDWAPLSRERTSWPPEDVLWFPDVGSHTFWLRAVDEADFDSVLEARLNIVPTPAPGAE